jgi:hypothetical protein
MSFTTTPEDVARTMILLEKVRGEIKKKQKEEELLIRELSSNIY